MSAKHTDAELECCEEHIVHTDAVMAARSAMPAEEITTAASDFFKAFSDKTRLRILAALVSAELCVCDIASLLNMSQSAISHQLRFLKQARLVKSRKNGKTVYYALCDDHKRQPRGQPRNSSIIARSNTMSVEGTTKDSG